MHAIIANPASLFSAARAGVVSDQGVHTGPADQSMCLIQGQHVHLHDGKEHVVTARRGTLWITQDGDARDWILEAGESAGFDRHGDILITAMSDAALGLDG